MVLGAATALLFLPLPFSLGVSVLVVSVAARQFLAPPAPKDKPGDGSKSPDDFNDHLKWGPFR